METRREIEIEAEPDEVWEAITTEEGRERWLDEPDREIQVESEEPTRVVWWWWRGDEPETRVEFLIVPSPGGTRVVVTESAPMVPLTSLARACALVAA